MLLMLSAEPADTKAHKIWSCIPSESGFISEKKTEMKTLIFIYTTVGDYKHVDE